MRIRSLVITALLALALCAAAPGVALAKPPKAPTKIIGIHYSYFATGTPTAFAAVSGRLMYRAMVHKRGELRGVYKPMANGLIRLYRLDDTTYRWRGVLETHVHDGYFSFDSVPRGRYLVQFGGSRNRTGSTQYFLVYADVLTISGFKGVSGSLDASGNEFVVLSAEVGAPVGVLTSAAPGALVLYSGLPSGLIYMMATRVATADTSFPTFSLHMQTIPAPGTYKIGYTIPAGSIDETVTAIAGIEADMCLTKTAMLDFKPSDLLP